MARAVFQYQVSMNSSGLIASVGLSIYNENAQPISSIDWGILYPDTVKNVTIFVKNSGTLPMTITVSVGGWTPSNLGSYLTLTSVFDHNPVAVGQMIPVKLSLAVSKDIIGITDFSFKIFIGSTG